MCFCRLFIVGSLFFVCGCTQFGHVKMERIKARAGNVCNTERATRLNHRALRNIKKGRWTIAEKLLLEALEADRTFGAAHNNLGRVFYSQGKYYEAAWQFQFAADKMPGAVEPVNNLGLVYETVDRLDEAIELYFRAYEMTPSSPAVLSNLARAKIRKGDDFEEIAPILRDLIFVDSRCNWVSWAKEHLAMAYKNRDQPDGDVTLSSPANVPTPASQPELVPQNDESSVPNDLPPPNPSPYPELFGPTSSDGASMPAQAQPTIAYDTIKRLPSVDSLTSTAHGLILTGNGQPLNERLPPRVVESVERNK